VERAPHVRLERRRRVTAVKIFDREKAHERRREVVAFGLGVQSHREAGERLQVAAGIAERREGGEAKLILRTPVISAAIGIDPGLPALARIVFLRERRRAEQEDGRTDVRTAS
jgi:hypothetical protein